MLFFGRTFSHDNNLTKLGTFVKGFGAAVEKFIAGFHNFSGDFLFAVTDVRIADNFSGDSRIAATEIGGCWLD